MRDREWDAGDQAFAGIRVLDLAGPSAVLAARMMADLGADVIKVEPPEGDAARSRGPFAGNRPHPERSLTFVVENSNKRGIALDLNSTAGRDRLRALADGADVVLETAPPGWMDARGIGYGELSSSNPGLVYTAVTPFGQTGPRAHYRASEFSAQAMSGALALAGERRERPVRGAIRIADKMAGYTAAAATAFALYHRLVSGRGQFIDISVQEAVLWQTEGSAGRYAVNGAMVEREGHRYPTATCPAALFPCLDGWVAIVASTPGQWRPLAEWIGDPRLLDERFISGPTRLIERDFIDPIIAEWTRTMPKQLLFHEGQRRGIPVGENLTPMETVRDAHLRTSGFFVAADHPTIGTFELPGAPYRLSETPWRLRRHAPLLGQHNDEVLGSLAGRHATAVDESAASRKSRSSCSTTEPVGLALSGVRVIDMTKGIAGPNCTRLLADQGAEVIKLEHPSELDPSRARGPWLRGVNTSPDGSLSFAATNRNKLGATLDLKTAAGRARFLELVKLCDVVVNNYRAGTMDRLGLGYDVLREVNPQIIVAEISGAGQTGLYREHVSYGQISMALAGAYELTGYPDGDPTLPGYTLSDFAAATMGAFAITSALIWRTRSGRGQHVDIPLLQTTASLMAEAYLEALVNHARTVRAGNDEPGALVHQCFRCAGEDQWCVIVIWTENEWTALRGFIGPSLPATPVGQRDAIESAIEAWTRQRSPREVMETLQAAGIEAARVQNARDLVEDDEHLKARSYFEEYEHIFGDRVPIEGVPFKMSLTPAHVRKPGPLFGADNGYVFDDLLGICDE